MRKLASLLLMTALVCLQALAIPANRKAVQVQQPDGTMLTIKLVGDEFYHFNTTTDGYTVMRNAKGAYVYAQLNGDQLVPTQTLAHDVENRSAAEFMTIASLPTTNINKMHSQQASSLRAQRRVDMNNFDYSKFRGLVILINCSDAKFKASDPSTFYTSMFSQDGFTGYIDPMSGSQVYCPGSVHDYFKDQSNGDFEPPFDVFGPYTTSYKSTSVNNNVQSIFKNIVNQANADIDFSKYDSNNDGLVDMIYFLVAGLASSFGGNNSGLLWPHQSYLSGYVDGKYLDRYACSTEVYGWESSPGSQTIEGIGTICHEFSHVLGLPDFYDTDYSNSGGESHHPGEWDLMSGGSDFNYGRSPAGYTLFERYALGWANVQELTSPGTYTIEPVNTGRAGYILRTEQDKEFFIIENRQKTSWDSYIPGHGMIVTRVDSTNNYVWAHNTINCNPNHMYFEMLRAGNTTEGDLASDPFPGTSHNSMLTNVTSPNLKTWRGYESNLVFTSIAENSGIITFVVENPDSIKALVEDFENMPVTTTTSEQHVEGNFASWSFTKSGVRAPGEDKANGENSVLMKVPCLFYSVTPVYYDIYMASCVVFNPGAYVAKYSLEYSTDDGANWTKALSTSGAESIEVAAQSEGTCVWNLDLKNTQGSLFRLTMVGGKKNVATYVDDFMLYYNGEPGGPSDGVYGDVNGDGEVNIADVNTIIDLILGGTANATTMANADVNSDGEININDINEVINVILSNS